MQRKKNGIVKKILSTTLFLLIGCLTAEAQMLVKQDGRVYVGQTPRLGDDSLHVLLMSLQGKYTEYHAGAKLGFGDFGQRDSCGWNVFVGEWDTVDSDMLWLHGKNGYKLTAWTGDWVVAQWKLGNYLVPNISIYDNVREDRLVISSDDSHKQSISDMVNTLSQLEKLHGIKYLYRPIKELKIPEGVSTEWLTGKSLTDVTRMNLAREIHNQGRIRYGFLTSEVAEVFPELVEEDESGNQYVNYIEIVPVLVNAVNEIANHLGLTTRGAATGGNEDSTVQREHGNGRNSSPEIADSAVLYQNTPNPFTDNTEIEYYVPADVTSAEIYIFSLSGLLLQTYPLSDFGHGYVTVSGSSLEAGMYVYALVVDGRIVDSKRMILTK